MASTNIVKAEVAGLYVNNARVAHITNVTVSFNNDLKEVVGTTTVKQFIYGRDSWSATSEGFVTFTDGYNWDYLMELLDQYQTLTLKIPTNEAGTDYLVGSVLIANNTITAGNTGEMVRMSLQFTGSGALTRVFASYPLQATAPQAGIDAAGCATSHPNTYYFTNQASYPAIQVGDTIYTDQATTTALTGQANKYIGIINKFGVAYQIDAAGEVIAIEVSTCGGQQF